jgi:Htaa
MTRLEAGSVQEQPQTLTDPPRQSLPGTLRPALEWGIKDSFRAYLAAVGGIIDVTAPAEIIGASYYRFPRAVNVPTSSPVITFQGTVAFSAHNGLLRLAFANPWIHFDDPHAGLLSIVADPRDSAPQERIIIADLTFPEPVESGGLLHWNSAGARLSGDGVTAFDFNYPPGTELSPLSFSWPAPPAAPGRTTFKITRQDRRKSGKEIIPTARTIPLHPFIKC